MDDYKIISDSSCDLPLHLIKEFDLDIISYYVSPRGDNNYYRENLDISVNEFYRILREEHTHPKTSMPNISDYLTIFRKNAEAGKGTVCICLTSKFSSSFQSATIAKNEIMEEYPNTKIEVIDSIQASGGQGLVVLEAVRMKKEGYPMEELVSKLNQLKHSARIMLTVESLEYLQRGGRIGKASAFAGSLLKIKPIIELEYGELHPHGKVRGRKNALAKVISLVGDMAGDMVDEYNFCVIHSDCLKDALQIKDKLANEYKINLELPIMDIGVTIGAHIGPSVIGIALMRKHTAM